MTDLDEAFVDDRDPFEQLKTRQAGLRDGYMRYHDEQRLDEVETDDD